MWSKIFKSEPPDVTPPGPFCCAAHRAAMRLAPLTRAAATDACGLRAPLGNQVAADNTKRCANKCTRWPLAACRLQLGFKGRSFNGQPVEQFDVWQKDDQSGQLSLWPGVMTLSEGYFNGLTDSAVPLDNRAPFLALLRYASAKDCGERCDLLGKQLDLMQGCRDAGGDKKSEAHHRQVMGLCLSCEGAD